MQQEIKKAEGEDAVLVPAGFDSVLDDDNLPERVAYASERTCLLLDFLSGRHIERRLDVIAIIPAVGDEIHFERFTHRLALPVRGPDYEIAHIHTETSYSQFIEDDVLHNVAFLLLAESEYRIADADVGEIVLRQRADIPLSLEVEADCLLGDERIAEIVNVSGNSRAGNA